MTTPQEPTQRPDSDQETTLEHGGPFHGHPASECSGRVCCLHNRTDHSMRGFRQRWRSDRGLMERICPHGVGHPDPDHLAALRAMGKTASYVQTESVHGCDGCCSG